MKSGAKTVNSQHSGIPRAAAMNNSDKARQRKRLSNTAKVRLLHALRKSEKEKQTLVEGLRGLVQVRYLSPDFRIAWTNADSEMGFRNSEEGVSPVYCYSLVRGRTEPCPDCEAREALQRKCLYENRESKPGEGRHFIARGIPVKDDSGEVLGVFHIAVNVTKHKETEDGLKITNAFLRSLLENSPTPICVSDASGCITTVNDAWVKTLGLGEDKTIGRQFHYIFSENVADRINGMHRKIIESNTPVEYEEAIACPTGLHHFHVVMFPLQDANGKTSAAGTILLEVTARKEAEQALRDRESELRAKSLQLEETNTALKVLLRQRDADQRDLEERIQSNIREMVLPYLNKMKETRLSEIQEGYMDVAITHLNEIAAPFLRQTVSQYPRVSARELQVATFVREGRSNKEIANLMHVSLNTIEIHRYNLRKKLGLQNSKANLRSFLLSLNKKDFTS